MTARLHIRITGDRGEAETAAKNGAIVTDTSGCLHGLSGNVSVGDTWELISPAGLNMLESFCHERLKFFATDRNNPNKNALSNLSPWIKFGEIFVNSDQKQ